ncbi:outer membrane beta-barrel protein [Helicobacter sp. 23-1044]
MKIINLIALAIAFAVTLIAQEISQDAQIEQLEKELRILELQNKIKQAKSGESSHPQQNLEINSKEPSGFMLGAGLALGYTIDESEHTSKYVSYTIDNSRVEYGGELLLGYKWFFGESGIFGMRLYADYQFLFSTAGINPIDAHIFSGNLDLMFNFNKSQKFKVGMIVGVNVGGGVMNYQYDRICSSNFDEVMDKTASKYEWKYCDSSPPIGTLGGNIGLRFVVKNHHAIEAIIQPRIGFGESAPFSIIGFARYIYTF